MDSPENHSEVRLLAKALWPVMEPNLVRALLIQHREIRENLVEKLEPVMAAAELVKLGLE